MRRFAVIVLDAEIRPAAEIFDVHDPLNTHDPAPAEASPEFRKYSTESRSQSHIERTILTNKISKVEIEIGKLIQMELDGAYQRTSLVSKSNVSLRKRLIRKHFFRTYRPFACIIDL